MLSNTMGPQSRGDPFNKTKQWREAKTIDKTMRKKPAPYTKQKTTPRGSNRETKRTTENEQRQTIESDVETIEKTMNTKPKP